MTKLKNDILRLHIEGKSYREIKQELNCSKSTISYYCNDQVREKNNNRLIQLRKRNRDYVWKIKAEQGCCKCGNKNPQCLDFHHKDNSTKLETIANLIHFATSIDKLQKEILQCDILCTNCHREQHYGNNHSRSKNVKHITNFKIQTECKQCGHKGVASLDFHHLYNKHFNIGKDCRLHTLEEIIEEIKKCIVLCANCHRILHSDEQN